MVCLVQCQGESGSFSQAVDALNVILFRRRAVSSRVLVSAVAVDRNNRQVIQFGVSAAATEGRARCSKEAAKKNRSAGATVGGGNGKS